MVENGNPLTLMIPPKYVIYFDAFAQTMIERHGKRLGRIPGAHAYAKEWTKGFSAVWEGKGGTLLTNNEIDYKPTAEFAAYLREQKEKFAGIIRRANIRIEQ